MSKAKIKLEVGMVIYCRGGYGSQLSKLVITRVTPKQAVVEGKNRTTVRFDREVCPNYFTHKGAGTWSRKSYSIETEELKQKYHRQRLEDIFSFVSVEDLTTDQLTRIILIIKEI